MAKTIKRILFYAVVALLVAAIVGTVALRLLGFQFRAVLSGSMEPALPVGSMLLVKQTPLADIRVGDDITFVRDKNLTVVTHRVIAVDAENELITTQGIANNTPDSPVYYENVLGVVKVSVPLLGYAVSWLDTTQGKIIAITAIVGAVLLWLILSLIFGGKERGAAAQTIRENQVNIMTQNAMREELFDETDERFVAFLSPAPPSTVPESVKMPEKHRDGFGKSTLTLGSWLTDD